MNDNIYFNVKLEFDRDKVDQIIHDTIVNDGKGYVCSVEGNVLAVANSNPEFNAVVNGALVNICDGNSIAMLASRIHKRKLTTYIGADLFLKYIKMAKYKSFFLGNTPEVLQGLKSNLSQYDPHITDMKFETLPFKNVEDFDYPQIAEMINENNPDIIWVSLGAPKQEFFMSKLQPYLNRGVMFGFGAIFNFNSGVNNQRAPKMFLKLKLEWVYRLYKEPKKQFQKFKMYTKVLPSLVRNEINSK
ncbi:MAG: WecB/TagA/CpsF family glycosyltransferase [Psychroserpens sp.]|uniref:WecB/TagA/CpsF family glycosyltransferase n=1 Tax=Psychroserpens sp. TaxID=2020870 RepID=UPI003C77B8A4